MTPKTPITGEAWNRTPQEGVAFFHRHSGFLFCAYPDADAVGSMLSLALYLLGGIRSVEIGSVMFGLQPDGSEKPAAMELVRLAFPRRVYTQSHVDYLAEVIIYLNDIKTRLRGVRIVEQPPVLRHFTARFAPAHGALLQEA